MDPFHLKLNCVDHYQAALTEFDPQFLRGDEQVEQSAFTRVPVIRVFGATETGQKVCAHIHGAFPYLFITYDGSLVSDEGMEVMNSAILDLTLYSQQLHPPPASFG